MRPSRARFSHSSKEKEHETELDRERAAHATFAAEHARVFEGRADLLATIADYVENEMKIPVVVCGARGSGKSALMAKAITDLQARGSGNVVVTRFIGITPEASAIYPFLRSICDELASLTRIAPILIPDKYEDLIKHFADQLAAAGKAAG